MNEKTSEVTSEYILIVAGDEHVGSEKNQHSSHGGHGLG